MKFPRRTVQRALECPACRSPWCSLPQHAANKNLCARRRYFYCKNHMPFAYYKWPLLAGSAIDIAGAISQLRRANGYLHLMLSGHAVIFTLLNDPPNAMILADAFS